jgi:AcrR family transcriptional regulator
MKKARGRPRKYNEEQVLHAAEQVFWLKGFSDTSLDDLANAMDMNRPSIYRAFGDKETLYRRVLLSFSQKMETAYAHTMLGDNDIRLRLKHFYAGALQVYLSGDQAKGCMVMSTAIAAATCHPAIQVDLLNVVHGLDNKFTEQFEQAIESGELPPSIGARARATVAQSLLHSLSLRARAGESQGQLIQLIDNGVEIITA